MDEVLFAEGKQIYITRIIEAIDALGARVTGLEREVAANRHGSEFYAKLEDRLYFLGVRTTDLECRSGAWDERIEDLEADSGELLDEIAELADELADHGEALFELAEDVDLLIEVEVEGDEFESEDGDDLEGSDAYEAYELQADENGTHAAQRAAGPLIFS